MLVEQMEWQWCYFDDFMHDLKENRIEYLQGLSDWDKYGNGWTSRTNRY